MVRSRWFQAIGGWVLLVGCASVPAPAPTWPDEVNDPSAADGSLTTNQKTYIASCQGEGDGKICTVTLTLTYTNQTGATVYLDHCAPDDSYPIYFLRWLTEAESAYSPVWACQGLDERVIEVAAGGQRTDTIELRGSTIHDEATGEPLEPLEGRLQLFYKPFSCLSTAEACELPAITATSNLFAVTLPDEPVESQVAKFQN